MKDGIYLDPTITQPSAASIEAILPFYKEFWGSPLALHQKGQELWGPIYQATTWIYEALGIDFQDHFTLTNSGAEAIASVFFSTYIDFMRETGQNHFLIMPTEDPAMLHAIKRLEALDCVGKWLPLDECGRLRPEALEEAIKPRVALLSLSWANGLTGVIQPIDDLTRVCQKKGIKIHVDASHVIGKLFFRFADAGIDYLTLEGSRFHCPQGVGALVCQKATPLQSLLGSYDMNPASLTALAVNMREAQENFDLMCTETARLRDKLEEGIRQTVKDAHLLFQAADRLPNVTVAAFPGIASEAMLYALNRRGVYASIGGGNSQKLQYILQACGTAPTLATTSISFSLSSKTQEEEIDRTIAIIEDTVHQLRTFSKDLS